MSRSRLSSVGLVSALDLMFLTPFLGITGSLSRCSQGDGRGNREHTEMYKNSQVLGSKPAHYYFHNILSAKANRLFGHIPNQGKKKQCFHLFSGKNYKVTEGIRESINTIYHYDRLGKFSLSARKGCMAYKRSLHSF